MNIMQLKLTKIGNSVGIILPKEMMGKMNVHKGDIINAVETKTGFNISPYDPEFSERMAIVDQLMKDNRNILKALAK